MNDFQLRVERLQALLQKRKIALAILSFSDQMRYLSGYAEHGHERLLALLVPAEGKPVFLVPSLSEQAARGNPAHIKHIVAWEDQDGWQMGFTSLLADMNVHRSDTLLIDDELPSVHLMQMQALMPGIICLPAGELLSSLRRVKSEVELAAMQQAASAIDSVADEVIGSLRAGVTEKAVQRSVLDACAVRGMPPAFTPLVCFGANGAMPHHASGETCLQAGDMVILDIGCMAGGYCSDITRTLSFGKPADADAEKVYDIVLQAHHAARSAARPGVSCEEVDAAARACIEARGYGKQFLHRTGHGIGLSCHEPPYIVRGNATLLEPGFCFSVEPGIYLPERFGVRLEVIAAVTAAGTVSLNADPPSSLLVV